MIVQNLLIAIYQSFQCFEKLDCFNSYNLKNIYQFDDRYRGQSSSSKQKQIVRDKLTERDMCRKKLKRNFKVIDMFGQQIHMTWQGDKTYKTMLGATMTWLFIIVMAVYTVHRVNILSKRLNPQLSKVTLIRSEAEEDQYRPQDSGFSFAFKLNADLDPSIGYFTVNYVNQTVKNNVRLKNRQPVPFSKCGFDGFSYADKAELQRFGINDFLCLNSFNNFTIYGNFYRAEMKYMEIKLWKCRNTTKTGDGLPKLYSAVCKDPEYIDNYLRKEVFNFAFVNNMFALDNYDNPVQNFIDDQLFFELDPGISKKANFYIYSVY